MDSIFFLFFFNLNEYAHGASMGLFWTLWFQVVIMGMMHCSQSFYVSLDFADGISVGIVVYGGKKSKILYR